MLNAWQIQAVTNAILALQSLLNAPSGTTPLWEKQLGTLLYARTDAVAGYGIQITMDTSQTPEAAVMVAIQFDGYLGGSIVEFPG